MRAIIMASEIAGTPASVAKPRLRLPWTRKESVASPPPAASSAGIAVTGVAKVSSSGLVSVPCR